jgi:hypothetical protein
MFLRFTWIGCEVRKVAVSGPDGVVIAELSFTPDDYELSTTRTLESWEFSGIEVYAEDRLRPRKSALKAVKTRRDRLQLRALYALEDGRTEPFVARNPDDSVSFFERLYGLEDPRKTPLT